jgi:hypothetical protein
MQTIMRRTLYLRSSHHRAALRLQQQYFFVGLIQQLEVDVAAEL